MQDDCRSTSVLRLIVTVKLSFIAYNNITAILHETLIITDRYHIIYIYVSLNISKVGRYYFENQNHRKCVRYTRSPFPLYDI